MHYDPRDAYTLASADAVTWTHYVPYLDDSDAIGDAIGRAVGRAIDDAYADADAAGDPIALAITDIRLGY
jgi:hypothetical protein